jgi:hypothetical protein
LADDFSRAEFARLERWLLAQAQSGVVGGQYNYSAWTKSADLLAAKAALEAAGWTVAVDNVAKIATIS